MTASSPLGRTFALIVAGFLVPVLAVPGMAVPAAAQAATGPAVPAAEVRPGGVASSSVTASSAYRYWSYWWGQADGGWTYASMGAPSTRPRDGAVEGWRFAISGDGPSSARAPRTQANMSTLCPDLTSAPSGQKRVAVVLDFGTAAEAPRGETPPPARIACVVVPVSANGVQVLAAATAIRSKDGLVCALSGYPQAECATSVAETPPTPVKPPVRKPVRAPVVAPVKPPVRKPIAAPRPPTSPVQPGRSVADQAAAPTSGDTEAADAGEVEDDATLQPAGAGAEAAGAGGRAGVTGDQPEASSTDPEGSVTAAQSSEAAPSPRDYGDQAATEVGQSAPGTSALAEEPVAFVRQDSEQASSASKVATLVGVTAVLLALAGFWLVTNRRRKARAAASFRHRRQR